MKTHITLIRLLNSGLCLWALAVLNLPVHAQSYSTGFENPPFSSGLINGQDSWVSANTNSRVLTAAEIAADLTDAGLTAGTTVHGGSQALLVSGGGASQNTTRTIGGIPNYSKVTLEVWARPLSPKPLAANLGNIFLTLEDSSNTRAAAFRFGFDGATLRPHIDYADGAMGSAIWYDTGIPWDPTNTWYRLTFEVDYGTQTYDFHVNGTKANAAPIAFYTSNFVKTLGQIRIFRGTSQAGMIVDDLSITSITPTDPIALFGGSTPHGFKVRIYDIGSATPATNTITLTLDGATITPTAIVQQGNVGSGDGSGITTVAYDSPTPILATGSSHTNVLHFEGAGFSPINRTFTFTVAKVVGSLDRTHHYLGRFQGTVPPGYSPFAGGRTGAAGDFAVDMGNTPHTSAKFFADDLEMLGALNGAIANDVLTCSMWIKRRNIASSSIFWLNSPNAPVSGRAFQLHCPYSDNVIYFDTGGGTVPTSRLSTNVTTHLGTTFWTTNWHHVVAIKNGGAKQIWIDGQLLAEQTEGAASISGYNDLNRLVLGAASPDSLVMNGLMDDFAAYSSALSPADIAALYSGTSPNAINAGSDLLVWWDFNDGPGLSLAQSGNDMVVTYSQVLQSATNATGSFTDVAGATSPHTNDLSASPQKFFRTRKY